MPDEKKEQVVLDMIEVYGENLVNEPEVIQAYKYNRDRLCKKINGIDSPEEIYATAMELADFLVLGFVYTNDAVPDHENALYHLKQLEPFLVEFAINEVHFAMLKQREKYIDILITDEVDTQQNRAKTFQSLIDNKDLDPGDAEDMDIEEKDESARIIPVLKVAKIDLAKKNLEELRKNMSEYFDRPSMLEVTELKDMLQQLGIAAQAPSHLNIFLN